MSKVKMTPAEVLAVMDGHIEAITSLIGHNSPIGAEWPKARAVVAELIEERDEYKREAAAQLQEMEDMHTLIMRQGELLTGVVNAIRGEPAEDCRHSHHDAAELAAALVAERDALVAKNARLLAALAASKDPCMYCQLPAEDMAKCRFGFPGCARADDMSGCVEFGAAMELAGVSAERNALREALQRIADYESEPGLSVLNQVRIKAIARAALAGAGHE